MTRMTASKAQGQLTELLDRVATKRERVVLRRGGKDIAVIVPMDDLGVLEQEELQDRLDAKEAERRLKNPKEVPIGYEQARKRLGLR